MINTLRKYKFIFGMLLNISMLWVLCASQIHIATEEHVSQSCTIGGDCHHKWHINSNYEFQILFHHICEKPIEPIYSFTVPVKELRKEINLTFKRFSNQTTQNQISPRGPPTT